MERKRSGMSSALLYLYEDEENQRLTMSGVHFSDFTAAVDLKRPLLISGSDFKQTKQSFRTMLHYIEAHEIEQFSQSTDIQRHPLIAIDIRSSHSLDVLTDVEIAELLFLMHMKRGTPLPFLDSIENELVYFSEHDGLHASVYLKDWARVEQLIADLVQRKFRQHARSVASIALTAEIMIHIRHLLGEGVLIDFESAKRSVFSRNITIPVYVAGRYEDMSVLHEDFEAEKESILRRGTLVCRKKKWSFELD
ncbi:hypothetical protein [uncultured Exiguobacterium sp.]|uniref:hypothetical protein n=1 Tax=uncultured Exiguobacterium sp. TaxID=202669 RepID=UPI0025EBE605|nr:hypothetical protein [uncultured Exiguobacterium sp.]